ncbi:MAG: protein-methionine-sulfoxide reductase catalytic subunit MsrP [Candidatus Eisenbacteria bacterium]|uniref:Protein-methionine-sulfoxide reductase catalytic subunit MsrP n=1 Tax=Eiseniibacteriota bacterium TaxID=2212470 RepID=A0A7Y2H0Z9_UNCEI|nr:protein-methionine-sulfoxide reductase catalytic subunit MsrP [Candidatus Eisenbacteria bacterium]
MPKLFSEPWYRSNSRVTPESSFRTRREFLRDLGVLGITGLVAAQWGCGHSEKLIAVEEGCNESDLLDITRFDALNATQNQTYALAPARALTSSSDALSHNNFYEFSEDPKSIWCLSRNFQTKPWSVNISGACEKQGDFNLESILTLSPPEERVYRHRCVEAWAMTVPWIGYSLRHFIDWCAPTNDATHVRFVSAFDASTMKNVNFIWPYYEGLRLDEARHDLALLATGMYGRELSPQNGAPLRLVLPWKYGYKSIKSIASVEFLKAEPSTFWRDIDQNEYPFLSNVDPTRPHTFWSQETERLLGTTDRVPTLPYNGYGEWVAYLYSG